MFPDELLNWNSFRIGCLIASALLILILDEHLNNKQD